MYHYVINFFRFTLPTIAMPVSKSEIWLVLNGVILVSIAYFMGHIISYISSMTIERYVHRSFGYPSTVFLRTCGHTDILPADETKELKKVHENDVFSNKFLSNGSKISGIILLLVMLPLWPGMELIKRYGKFSFYRSNIDAGLLPLIKIKFQSLGTGIAISHNTKWPKIIEHFVANNCPLGYARLYNYLVIYGALRSMALIMLIFTWMFILDKARTLYYRVALSVDGVPQISIAGKNFKTAIENNESLTRAPFDSILLALLHFVIIIIISSFVLMAFCKFNRRFFEESIFAFLFDERDVSRRIQVEPLSRTPNI